MEGRRRYGYKLKRNPQGDLIFDGLVTALYGERRVKDIAGDLDMGPDNWSQVRTGARFMSDHAIICCVEEILPGIPPTLYADKLIKTGAES